MKKIIILFVILFSSTLVIAQEDVAKDTTYWTKKGNFKFLFNQSAFSNWVAGGDNTIAGNIGLNYDFNYAKDNFTWDNKILASYGITRSQNSEFEKKTDDRLEYNSVMGWNAGKYWRYSLLVNFKTQFTKGYKYGKDENKKEIRTEYTNFWSPANLLIGPGMLWEKSKNFSFNIAPATAKFVFVDEKYTLPNKAYFGVEEGKSMRFELGINASGYLKHELMENITMEHILNFYANYLENLQNVDIDYTMNINMKVNKYFSTDFIFQTRYDDNAFQGFQIREVFGFGFNYNF
jgi:hypothetical protein